MHFSYSANRHIFSFYTQPFKDYRGLCIFIAQETFQSLRTSVLEPFFAFGYFYSCWNTFQEKKNVIFSWISRALKKSWLTIGCSHVFGNVPYTRNVSKITFYLHENPHKSLVKHAFNLKKWWFCNLNAIYDRTPLFFVSECQSPASHDGDERV